METNEHNREQERQGRAQEKQSDQLGTLAISVARLEEKHDALAHEVRAHLRNKLLHFGTVAGASGPLMLGIAEVLRHFFGVKW